MIAVGQGELPAVEEPALPATLPVLPLRDTVTFPDTLTPLAVGQPRSISLINDVLAADRRLVMVASRDPEVEEPGPEQLYDVGVAGTVARMLKVPDGTLRVLVQGAQRVKIEEWVSTEPYLVARVSELPEVVTEGPELEALVRNVKTMFTQIIEQAPYLPEELQMAVANVDDPSALSYLIAGSLRIPAEERQALLEEDDVARRLRRLSEVLARELEVVEIGTRIHSQVQSEMDKTQREYYLRQQLKAIQEELGERDPAEAEVEELREQLAELELPERRAQAGRPRALAAGEAAARVRRARRHPHLAGVDRLAAVERAHRRQPRPRARPRGARRRPLRHREDQGPHHRVPRGAQAHARGRAARRSSASSGRPASARRRSGARSRARWAASSSASAPAACATRPRSAATAAPTSARCPA